MDREKDLKRYPVGDRPEPEAKESGIYRTALEEPDSTAAHEQELDRFERYLTEGCFCT